MIKSISFMFINVTFSLTELIWKISVSTDKW